MARNIKVTISSTDDATTRDNVPDRLVSFDIDYLTNAGVPQNLQVDRYFLVALNWLLTNDPDGFKQLIERVTFRIERVRAGIDDRLKL